MLVLHLAIAVALLLSSPSLALRRAGRATSIAGSTGRTDHGREELPSEIPLFPLPDVVLFPGVTRPLLIFEPRYREMVADALKGDRVIGMVMLRPGFEKDYEGRPPSGIGCAGVSGIRADARWAIRHPAPRPDDISRRERGSAQTVSPCPGPGSAGTAEERGAGTFSGP